MLRIGERYRASLRDERQAWIDGERVKHVEQAALLNDKVM